MEKSDGSFCIACGHSLKKEEKIKTLRIRIPLIIFSVVLIVIILGLLRKNKLPIKYSLVWFIAIFVLFLIAVFPYILEFFAKMFGFITMSNLVVGIMLTLLLGITLILTMMIFHQKKQITMLIQEVSLIKGEKNGK